jgi:hypothetical protein
MSNSADDIYKQLYKSSELEMKNEEKILKTNIKKGLIIKGNMYLNNDTGEIKVNEKYMIKPLMNIEDIKKNLLEILAEQSKEELNINAPSSLILKTIIDTDYSIDIELCLYENRLEKIRMSIVATILKDLVGTEYYTFEYRLAHTLDYLEKLIKVNFIEDIIKRDRIIFNKGIINIISDNRISDVRIVINYNTE